MKKYCLILCIILCVGCTPKTSIHTDIYQQWRTSTASYLNSVYKHDGIYGVVDPNIESNGYWIYRALRINQFLGDQQLVFNHSQQWLTRRLETLLNDPGKVLFSFQTEVYFLIESMHILGIAPENPQRIITLIQDLQQPQGYFAAAISIPGSQPDNESNQLSETYFSVRILDLLGQKPRDAAMLSTWLKTMWKRQTDDAGAMASILTQLSMLGDTLSAEYSWLSILNTFKKSVENIDNYGDLAFVLDSMLSYAEYAKISDDWIPDSVIEVLNDPNLNQDGIIIGSDGTPDLLLSENLYHASRYSDQIKVNPKNMRELIQRHIMPDGSMYPMVSSDDDPIVTSFAHSYADLFELMDTAPMNDQIVAHLLDQNINIEELYMLVALSPQSISTTNQQKILDKMATISLPEFNDLSAYFYYIFILKTFHQPISESLAQEIIALTEQSNIDGSYGIETTTTAFHSSLAVILYSYLEHTDYDQQKNIDWIKHFLDTIDQQNPEQFSVREVYLMLLALDVTHQPLPDNLQLKQWIAGCLAPQGNGYYTSHDPSQSSTFYILPYTLSALSMLGVDPNDAATVDALMQPQKTGR